MAHSLLSSVFTVVICLTAPHAAYTQEADTAEETPPSPAYTTEFAKEDFKDSGTFRVTNRITAQSTVITLDKETPYMHDDTELTLHSCWRAPLTRKPESAALISALRSETPGASGYAAQEDDTQKEEKPASEEPLFYGWVYASAPSVTYIQHPIYTFRLLECGALIVEPEENSSVNDTEDTSAEDTEETLNQD